MKRFGIKSVQANVLWLEPCRALAAGRGQAMDGLPTETQLTQLLSAIPPGPTVWIVDDLWAPCFLLRDAVDVPQNTEEQEAFFKWRYTQSLALEGNHVVQHINVGEGGWLLGGMEQELREQWIALALKMGRPIHQMIPRWLWLYNHLAATRDLPGMILSLCPMPEGGYTGSLAAWGRNLAMLRQWSDPLDAEGWIHERIFPTASFLQRESRSPQEAIIWGAPSWPDLGIHTRVLPPEFPAQETI